MHSLVYNTMIYYRFKLYEHHQQQQQQQQTKELLNIQTPTYACDRLLEPQHGSRHNRHLLATPWKLLNTKWEGAVLTFDS